MAKTLLAKNAPYPDLYAAVFQCLQSPHPEFRESGFRILSAVPKLLVQDEALDLTPILPSLKSSLSEKETLPVKLVALTSAVNLLIEASLYAKHGFTELMVCMLNTLPHFLSLQDEASLTEAFTSLIDLATSVPTLFKPILPQLIEFSMSVLTHPQWETKTKHSNLELVLTLVDEAPQMIRQQVPQLAQHLVPYCFHMMADLEDSSEWHTTVTLDADPDEQHENHVVGEQSMDRLALKLGAGFVVTPAFQCIEQGLNSPHWQQRHAALLVTSAIGEGCHAHMLNDLPWIVNRMIPYTQDPHPRVRHAACNCLGQLATDFAPDFQHSFHATVIPALMQCMEDPHPRVHAHGAAALINVCDHIDQSDIATYLEPMLLRLSRLAQSPLRYVQEQALTTLATVADAAHNLFIPYYPSVMPWLFQVISSSSSSSSTSSASTTSTTTATTKTGINASDRVLKGKALECATFIAMAVQKPVFLPDAPKLLDALTQWQQQVTEPDDPLVPYLLHGWARMCQVLGEEFIPFLPLVMPPLLHSVGLQPDLAFLDHEDNGQAYAPEDGWEHTVIEGQRICIRTTPLEEKHTALEMLTCYARNLGSAFESFAPSVLEIVIPLLDFYFHDGVRRAAMISLPYLLQTLPMHADMTRNYFYLIMEKSLRLLPTEMDIEMVYQIIVAIQPCLVFSGHLFNADQMNLMFQVFVKVCLEFVERVQARQSNNHHKAASMDFNSMQPLSSQTNDPSLGHPPPHSSSFSSLHTDKKMKLKNRIHEDGNDHENGMQGFNPLDPSRLGSVANNFEQHLHNPSGGVGVGVGAGGMPKDALHHPTHALYSKDLKNEASKVNHEGKDTNVIREKEEGDDDREEDDAEGNDEEGEEDDEEKEEREMEQHVMHELTKWFTTLLKVYGGASLQPYLETYILPMLQPWLHQVPTADVLILTYSMVSDIIDHLGSQASSYFVPSTLLRGLTHASEQVRQTSAYLIGLTSKYPNYQEVSQSALPYLLHLLQSPHRFQPGHVLDTENAVASVGKLLCSTHFQWPSEELKAACQHHFCLTQPVIMDVDEAPEVLSLWCQLMETSFPHFPGSSFPSSTPPSSTSQPTSSLHPPDPSQPSTDLPTERRRMLMMMNYLEERWWIGVEYLCADFLEDPTYHGLKQRVIGLVGRFTEMFTEDMKHKVVTKLNESQQQKLRSVGVFF
ncbi:hypothetical protein HMI54_010601 [Coelomomyces lativittatus]|nr:hypothetical protein HMI56_004073 [Coelomomyces lativittatus]KAJ1513491.1 hypothetical protein HMI55_005532 [Coelomomyces lativittatus]KAJ1516169.1 hypothetical protein HMI54_010601 [Coelomomyces lativittatus]